MRKSLFPAAASASALLTISLALPGWSQVNVLTQHNDNARSGANLHETVLNTKNVNVKTFGKLFSRPVEGQLYAQPLYVSRFVLPEHGTRNVVFVATERNNVYAFDADDPAATKPFWHVNLGLAAHVPNKDFGNRTGSFTNIVPDVGITGTPVIDLPSQTLFVVAFTKDPLPKERYVYRYRLHALDMTSGKEKPGSPVIISGQVNGTGSASVGGILKFDSKQHIQRTSLLLSQGSLYFGFAGFADTEPYHGWVMAYDAKTLKQQAILCTTPDSADGGIWQAGQGFAADPDGNVYVATSNGQPGSDKYGRRDLSDNVIKLKLGRNGLNLVDWFAPYNRQFITRYDLDLGNCGPMLVPGTNYLIQAGKAGGIVYVLDRNNLGHWRSRSDYQIVQSFQGASDVNFGIYGSSIAWPRAQGTMLYMWGVSDYLKGYRLQGRRFRTTPDSSSTMKVPNAAVPGGILSLSANGDKAGTGIIWATHPISKNAAGTTVEGVARAFDATNLKHELWNSEMNPARDDVGNFAKFTPPTIADGKVFMPTFSNRLDVYGLLSSIKKPAPAKVEEKTGAPEEKPVEMPVQPAG